MCLLACLMPHGFDGLSSALRHPGTWPPRAVRVSQARPWNTIVSRRARAMSTRAASAGSVADSGVVEAVTASRTAAAVGALPRSRRSSVRPRPRPSRGIPVRCAPPGCPGPIRGSRGPRRPPHTPSGGTGRPAHDLRASVRCEAVHGLAQRVVDEQVHPAAPAVQPDEDALDVGADDPPQQEGPRALPGSGGGGVRTGPFPTRSP
jgi:hypothetical protein